MPASTLPKLSGRHPITAPSPGSRAGTAARSGRASIATTQWERPAPVPADPWLEPAAWNCDRVRRRTVRLVGVGGHRALLHRALARAGEEVEWLSALSVCDDGQLSGLGSVLPSRKAAERRAACLAVRKQYVALLLEFLGEGLTHKLVGDDWPELLASARETAAPAQGSDAAAPARSSS